MIPNHPLIASVKPLLKATGAELITPDALIAGDIPLMWDGTIVAGVRLPALHGALDRIIEGVERELGARLSQLSRNENKPQFDYSTNAVHLRFDVRLKTLPMRWVSRESRSTTISTHYTVSHVEHRAF